MASDPDIVTPIGIAVDSRDRLFVLESHTHTQPSDYPGPKSDRVRIFADANHDGRLESSGVFADGFDDGMNLAIAPNGDLYLVTARAVVALHDRDRDGVSEARTEVLRLTEPSNVYAHAALLGVAFSPEGWLYLSRGNTGGAAWRLEGTDGSAISGYGDGGNIVRSRLDGSSVQEVATGFWNPFGLEFDREGRLLATDNDPDSRGPNRLVQVVDQGDYGYKSLYGGSGVHPYQSWNGELPGTLPYAAPLGEAPSGLVSAARSSLPAEYVNDVLVAVWEESRIVRVRLRRNGASVTGAATSLVEGGNDFRPVSFAAARDGSIYFTDWVLREYPNHRRGRIWRLRTRPGVRQIAPASPAPAVTASAVQPSDAGRALTLLRSADAFERHEGVTALSRPAFRAQALAASNHSHPLVRLGGLLALERGGGADESTLGRLLGDPDPAVRRMTLIVIGRGGMTSLEAHLDRAIAAADVSSELFETYLATIEQLQPAFVRARAARQRGAGAIPQVLPSGFLQGFVLDAARPARLRALALKRIEVTPASVPWLLDLARRATDQDVRVGAIRAVALAAGNEIGPTLQAIAREPTNASEVRAEAIVALGWQPVDATSDATALVSDTDPEVRHEAARYLRARARPAAPGPTVTLEQWQARVATGGNAARGQRVFFSARSTCATCHAIDGRGGTIGPALTGVGQSKTRAQLLRAILRPSDEAAPEWQGWEITMRSGETHVGRQIDIGDTAIDLMVPPGKFITVKKSDVQSYRAVERSLMPDGLESGLSADELRDLLAFLSTAPSQR